MAIKRNNKNLVVVAAKQLIAGTAKHLTNSTPVAFLGGSFTADQITSKLQRLVVLRADVDAAKAAAQAKLAAEATETPALVAFMNALRAFVKVNFGTSPDVLADFGIHPKARAALTVEAKAAAVAKRAATRAARHTMGTKQKKGIKGTVDTTTVTAKPTAASAPTVPSHVVDAPSTGAGAATAPHVA